MKQIFALAFACLCGALAYEFALRESFINPYPVLCSLVVEKIYMDSQDLKNWQDICFSRSHLVKPSSPRKLIIKDMNNVLSILNVSHLEVYDSEEVKNIWQGDGKETGVFSEFVDSELVIFKVHGNSPAEKAQLKKGDIIKAINGEQPSPWEAQATGGDFLIRRKGQEFIVKVTVGEVHRDQQIKFRSIQPGVGLLEVPSFRADFFANIKMQELAKKMAEMKTIILDLRENEGGNFVSGLRLLSLFVCEPTYVGQILRPHFQASKTIDMPDELEDQKQLDLFYQNRNVRLLTFANKICFRGSVRVLVNSKSASVSEMVAQALKEVRGARIMGSSSRGQLLVGVWYPLHEVGPGVEISIPEAVYISKAERRIEGNGVQIDKVLYYNLDEMQSGVDSWVKRVLD